MVSQLPCQDGSAQKTLSAQENAQHDPRPVAGTTDQHVDRHLGSL